MEEREARGFLYWDVRAATYAQNIMKVAKLIMGGLAHYSELQAKMNAGKKRIKREHLKSTLTNVLLPALASDMAAPKFFGIKADDYPGNRARYECLHSSGAKITNVHMIVLNMKARLVLGK